MIAADADRHLLFGLLAFQSGMIDGAQFVAALAAWDGDEGRAMADFLVGQGSIDAESRAAVESRVSRQMADHGGDTAKSLAALRVGASTLGDGNDRGPGPDPTVRDDRSRTKGTVTASLLSTVGAGSNGATAGDGPRFRVLRPHARGGLGAVFVALDAELNREVALKQILDRHADDPNSRTRFVLEAEITGGLEHPGIVPVYGLGAYGDGRPYYAMRFIRGESLRDAIIAFHADPDSKADAGRRSLALRTLLRRFTDVCNAIEYAHNRGVIHRDIKPANIIVGKHGETLVVDWGLAKTIGRPGNGAVSEERVLSPSSSSGSAETLPGSAMGTPTFMSPEQAAGEIDRIGPRSDIYSLGATLYYLLTGKPPFAGDDILTILAAVRAGDFPRPRTRQPSTDRALEAVCLKAMARDPEDRYATARALAEDIERWAADEPVSAWREPWSRRARRWARRHQTMVAVAVSLLVTAVVGLTAGALLLGAANRRTDDQRRLAVANLVKAEANYRLAHDAVDRFLGGIMDNRLLNEPHMIRLRRDLLAGAREFFQAFVDQRGGDPEAKLDLALAHVSLARIQNLIGEVPGAIAQDERAVAILDSVSAADPARERPRRLLVTTLNDLASHLRDLGRLGPAEATFGRAIDEGDRLSREHPGDIGTLTDLADVLIQRGVMLYNSGRSAQSEADLRRALAIVEPLPRDGAAAEVVMDTEARALQQMGGMEFARERWSESRSWRERAVKVAEDLLARDPKSARRRSTLAAYLTNLGTVYAKLRDHSRAVATLQRSAEANRALSADDPAVTEYESRLSMALTSLSVVYQRMGQLDRAEEVNLEAIAVQERLARQHPEVIQYHLSLGSSCGNEGNFWLDRKQHARALPWFEKSVAMMETLLNREPGNVMARRVLRNGAWGQADSLIGLDRPADALPALDRGIALAQGTAALEMRLVRAAALVRTGAIDRGLAEAESVLADPAVTKPDAAFLFAVAAKAPALASGLILAGRGPDPAARARRADALSSLAVAWLRRADSGGFFRRNPHRVPEYRDAPEFDSLRPREDFRLLIQDLSMPADPFARTR